MRCLAWMLALAVLAVQTGPILLVLPAIAVFILCQYVAVLALNPDSLSLSNQVFSSSSVR